jgi:hypothetical protein
MIPADLPAVLLADLKILNAMIVADHVAIAMIDFLNAKKNRLHPSELSAQASSPMTQNSKRSAKR